jgi:citrate synthase
VSLASIEPIHAQLAASWGGGPAAAKLIRAALVLCADHELNASTFTVRCVASTRATPYGAVIAGLAALQGPRHGGQTARVAALFDEVARADSPGAAVAARLRRGERLPGFGHILYPEGDPRYTALRRLLAGSLGSNPALDMAVGLADAAVANTGLAPNWIFPWSCCNAAWACPWTPPWEFSPLAAAPAGSPMPRSNTPARS